VPPLKLAPPPADASPALLAAREELGILHEIFAVLGNGWQIRAVEHAKAGKVLGYLDALIIDAQARHDALLPPEATQPAASDAPPAIASKEPEAAAAPVAG